MGDTRFERPYHEVRDASDRAAAIHALPDEDVIGALVVASAQKDPYLANVLASEAMNRVRRKGTIVQTANEGLVSQDLEGRLTYMNPAAERMLGWTMDELLGRRVHDIVHLDEQGRPLDDSECAALSVARSAEPAGRQETWYTRKDGTRFPIEQTAAPILRDGDVEGVVVTFTDITERKRAEGAMRQLATIVEASDDAIVLYALDGTLLTWNRGAQTLYGFTADEMVGRSVLDLELAERREAFGQAMQEAARGSPVRNFETTRLRKDGSAVEVSVTLSPVRDGSGRVVALSGVSRDITHRRRMEAARRESEARKAAMLHASLDAIITIDAESRILEWNRAAETIFGWSASEAIGRALPDLIIPPRYREAHHHGLARYVATGEGPVLGRRIELPALRRDGSEFPAELSILPLQAGDKPLFTGYLRDITEQKRAQVAQRESEERFRLLFAANPLPTIVFDEGTLAILDVNDVAVETYGYSREELLAMRATDLRPEADVERFLEYVRQHPRGPRHSVGWQHRLKDGRLIDVEVATHTVAFRGRSAILAVVNDVTERKRVHRELLASEERFRAIYESSPTMYFTVAADGTILSVNGFGARYLGYAPEELVGRKAWELYHPDDQPAAQANHLDLMARPYRLGEVRQWEGRKVSKQGNVIWAREALTRVPLSDERVAALVACFDISDAKRTAAQLEAERARVLDILESITDAFLALDRQWRFTYLNEAAERVMVASMGRGREGLLGRTYWEMLPEAAGTEFDRQFRKVMETREPAHFEAYYEPFRSWFEVHAYPTEEGVSVFFRDVTERRRTEEALREAKEELERRIGDRTQALAAANRELETFSYLVSHDLKEPVRAVEAYLDALAEDHAAALPPDARELVERSRAATARLDNLLRGLLELARIGHVATQEEARIDVHAALQSPDCSARYEHAVSERRARVEVRSEPGLVVRATDAAICQIVGNLILNAVVHNANEAPLVVVSARREGHAVVLAVEDNGGGFPRQVVEAFERPVASASALLPSRGSGFGLLIARRMAERLGGRISICESELGGARVRVELPAHA